MTGLIIGRYLPMHMGHVNAVMKASYMCDELFVVIIHNKDVDHEICNRDSFKYILPEVRARWITLLTKDMKNVRIISVEEEVFENGKLDFSSNTSKIFDIIGKPIKRLFHTDLNYRKQIIDKFPKIEILIEQYDLKKFSISSTMIRREGIMNHWDEIPNFVRPYFVKKVVIVGTESSGKSTLTKHLARLYNTNHIEEYGRRLCEDMGGYEGIFTPDLFQIIAYGHKMAEFKEINYSNKILFVDTEIISTQYFSELMSGKDPILDIIAENNHYDLWIYLEPDIEWVEDGLRSYGNEDERMRNNDKLKQMLDERDIEYHVISGSYINRITSAIKLVDEVLAMK
jgi:HTH-type transcriptional repressor of NAD biosynthesis genes